MEKWTFRGILFCVMSKMINGLADNDFKISINNNRILLVVQFTNLLSKFTFHCNVVKHVCRYRYCGLVKRSRGCCAFVIFDLAYSGTRKANEQFRSTQRCIFLDVRTLTDNKPRGGRNEIQLTRQFYAGAEKNRRDISRW